MPDTLPILYATRHPRSGQWLVDTNADYVRAAAAHEGAEVVTVDVPGLLRVREAAQRYADLSDLPCDYEDLEPGAPCPGIESNGGPCHWCELRAALAAGAGEGEK